MREFDAIVLGLGGIGSGAAYWLAKRGLRILGLEQFELGHVRGESHDHSRIIRLSYVTPAYVAFAKQAYQAWASLERDAGEQLVFRTGGLDLGPRQGAISIDGYAAAMHACDVAFQWLDAAEIRRRWPQFTIGDDVHGLFQADGGIVAANAATRQHQRAARAYGAVLKDHACVTAIDVAGGEITVQANDTRYQTGRLIIAAGPWSAEALTHFGVTLPLEVTKEQAMYFAVNDVQRFARERFPVWIWMDDPSFYGFPVFGEAGMVKVTQDAGGQPVDPNGRSFDPDVAITQRVGAFIRRHLNNIHSSPEIVKTCLYTLTPDRDFVIDRLVEYPNVSVAIGAGHAFKFASVIGRVLSELACDGVTTSDIAAFSLNRSILQMEAPPRNYMV